MNIIFLDIDGVLTSARAHVFGGDQDAGIRVWSRFDPIALLAIQTLCRRYDAQVVVSSMWRTFYNLRQLSCAFINAGVDLPLHEDWKTDSLPGVRGVEIEEWLNRNHADNYLILDDEETFLPHQEEHLVRTDPVNGFNTMDMWYRANAILSRGDS